LAEALLLHGAGGGAWEWQLWRGVLQSEGVHCRAADLQAAGTGLVGTGLDDYLRQTRAAYHQALATQQPVLLIGASLGGLLALMLAGEAAPSALVLINSLPPAPLHAELPARHWPDRVPWGRERSLAGTRRNLFDADDATCLAAFRRWRDESGLVLRQAAGGVELPAPACPVLLWASEADADVPVELSRRLAQQLGAEFRVLPGASHVGPLLGRSAAGCARQTVAWLNTQLGLRADSPPQF
jgi:pimeloyl-ACP methyl ester carboxylesterase